MRPILIAAAAVLAWAVLWAAFSVTITPAFEDSIAALSMEPTP